jgi:putative serine protease PepD
MTPIQIETEGRRFVFTPDGAVTIGRAANADIVVTTPTVGRRHARLVPNGDAWHLIDAGSRNGTWVDGGRIRSIVVDRPIVAHLGNPDSPAVIAISPVDQAADEPPPVLVTRLGTEQRIFPVGMVVRVGRDPAMELVSTSPLVSRGCHGVIASDRYGATYTDKSRRGTFKDGKPLRRPLRITESVVLRLGDPATGEELGITPPLPAARLARNRVRRLAGVRTRTAALVAGSVAVAVAVAATLVLTVFRPTATARDTAAAVPTTAAAPTTLPAAALNRAEAATVRLLMGSPDTAPGWGSGTIISPRGLILTNGHVAEPRAAGEAVAIGAPGSTLHSNPPYLTVELTDGQASPVVARYRAHPVAVDGYLDLAVVQIYATSAGVPIDPASLQLPSLDLGNVSSARLDQHVTVLGFPGVADSDSITVTDGVISTFVPDPLGHVTDPRFELETTARVAHGNSGGAAIDDAGRLIGVPSLVVTDGGGDVSWRLRSVAEAEPLITAARKNAAYQSRLLVQLTGNEHTTGTGIGTAATTACTSGPSLTGKLTQAYVGVGYAGFTPGTDIALLIRLPGGETDVIGPTGGLPQTTATDSSGCFAYGLTASQFGLTALPSGTYTIQLLAGPNLDPVGTRPQSKVEK